MKLSPRAVTFDCWSTLVVEADGSTAWKQRVACIAQAAGLPDDSDVARTALSQAWGRHIELWERGVGSGAPEIARWTLETLAAREGRPTGDAAVAALTEALAEASLAEGVRALPGARESLERLADAGIRRALICDTGISPGRVVRRLLDEVGLLAHLEVTIFSDEIGVPKPHGRPFAAALEALDLGADPTAALHVGDLRRTDVAGARAAGMGSVRLRAHHDDPSDHPEADHVADSHAHLLALLGLR